MNFIDMNPAEDSLPQKSSYWRSVQWLADFDGGPVIIGPFNAVL